MITQLLTDLHLLTQAVLLASIALGGWVFVDMMREAKNWRDDDEQ
jgi:hypothetical protein